MEKDLFKTGALLSATAASVLIKCLLKSSPLHSEALSGLCTKSKAPRSRQSSVTLAPSLVSVLAIMTLALIPCLLSSFNIVIPSILGMLISSTTASYVFFFKSSSPSTPSRALSATWNLESELMISLRTVLMSAESSINKIFFIIMFASF